jgi:hypothetical protein
MVSLALVLAILAAIGPVLELDAAGLQVMAPLIQQRLKERMAERRAPARYHVPSCQCDRERGRSKAHTVTCVQFRCSE